MKREECHKYDDMLYLPHPTSPTRPRMSIIDRAAQFSPFAALTGYDDAVKETARLTERKIELDEYEKMALDGQLQRIRAHLSEQPQVTITYFQADERKDGGAYQTITGNVKKVDEYKRKIVLVSGEKIEIEEIVEVTLHDCK